MTKRIDLNADLGEECGDDAAMLDLVSTANIACGGHAGGGQIMRDTMVLALDRGVAIGAHPSYPDRENFGRTSLLNSLPRQLILDSLIEQIVSFLICARELDAHPEKLHVKAHGALYNDAAENAQAANIIVEAVVAASPRLSLPIMGMPNSTLAKACEENGIPFISEGFTDRAYTEHGVLIPRSQPGAVLEQVDEVVAQSLLLASGTVITPSGVSIHMPVETLCVHGDTKGSVILAHEIRGALNANGFRITSRP